MLHSSPLLDDLMESSYQVSNTRETARQRFPCGQRWGGSAPARQNVSMSNALATIADQVRQRVRRDGVDLSRDSELASRYVRDEVRRYSERALGGSVPLLADEAQATREVVAALTGYGPLQPFFDDDTVEELWINGPEQIFVARNGMH